MHAEGVPMGRKADAENAYQAAVLAEYAEIARNQRDWARVLAAKIEAGEMLQPLDAMFVASIVRLWADNLKDQPPRKRGQLPKFNHADAAMLFFAWTETKRMTKTAAIAKLAERYGVTVEAMSAVIAKRKNSQWRAFFRSARPKQFDRLDS